jgi:hypothetical protein
MKEISPCEHCSCENECEQRAVVAELSRLYALVDTLEDEAIERAIHREMDNE